MGFAVKCFQVMLVCLSFCTGMVRGDEPSVYLKVVCLPDIPYLAVLTVFSDHEIKPADVKKQELQYFNPIRCTNGQDWDVSISFEDTENWQEVTTAEGLGPNWFEHDPLYSNIYKARVLLNGEQTDIDYFGSWPYSRAPNYSETYFPQLIVVTGNVMACTGVAKRKCKDYHFASTD